MFSYSLSGQLTLLMYTVVYIRFMKDQIMTLALLSLILMFFTNVVQSFLMVYHWDDSGNKEEMRMLMLRNFRGVQVASFLQAVYSIGYHSVIDLEHDVCRWKYGYWFTEFIGDLQCGKGGRPILIFLDLIFIYLQLLSVTYMATNVEINTIDFKVNMTGLKPEDYGILSILRFNPWELDPNTLKITLEEFDADLGDSDMNYDSINVLEDS